jgi:hypothetical protein
MNNRGLERVTVLIHSKKKLQLRTGIQEPDSSLTIARQNRHGGHAGTDAYDRREACLTGECGKGTEVVAEDRIPSEDLGFSSRASYCDKLLYNLQSSSYGGK